MNRHFFIYGSRFIIFSVFLLLVSCLFCYYIDPFSVYGRVYVKNDVAVNSPGFTKQLRMGKAIGIMQHKPEVLIMGSSRSAFGFSSQVAKDYFPRKKVYNGSLSSTNIYEILRYFQHSAALSPLQQVFIGLDFYQFHGQISQPKNFREDRLAVDVNNQPSGNKVNDSLATLLSGDALFYSIKVATGLCNWDDIYLINGFKEQGDRGGSLHSFIKSEKTYIDKTYTIPEFTFKTPDDTKNTFDYFRQIIQLAHKKKIKLHFFISPSHARQWEVIGQLGLWDKWEYWKHEMLNITQHEAQPYSQAAFLIHDFSGYSTYSTEMVPRTDDIQMHWYSDSSHYKQALGNIILGHITNNSSKENFGRILSTQNINDHLQLIRVGREQYRRSHEQDIADIKKLIDIRNAY
jgi:hypothetical protein